MPVVPASAGPFALVLLVAAVGIAAGFLVSVAARVAGRWAKRSKSAADDELARRLALPLALAAGAVTSGLALAALAGRLEPTLVASVRRGLTVLFVAAAAWALVRGVRVSLDVAGERRPRLLPATRLGGRLAAVVLYVAAFLTVLSEYGVSVTPLLTGLGIAALAIALAFQDTLANFFAGIWIQTGRSMQPGHFVRLEDEGLEGYVEQVGWRTTRLRTLAGNTIILPNARLAQAVVTDYHMPSPDQSVVMEFLVGLESDPRRVMAALVEEARAAAAKNPGFVPGVDPFAQFAGIEPYALKFSLIIRVNEFVQKYQAQHDVRLLVLDRFRREGIRIPYPTRHNLQESVAPPPRRGGPGRRRPQTAGPPPQPLPDEPPAQDPREAEAEKAKTDIAAQQENEGKSPPG